MDGKIYRQGIIYHIEAPGSWGGKVWKNIFVATDIAANGVPDYFHYIPPIALTLKHWPILDSKGLLRPEWAPQPVSYLLFAVIR